MKNLSRSAVLLATVFLLGTPHAQASEFSDEQICKATIAFLMVQKTSIMKAESSGNEVIVTYKRPSDGEKFVNKCQIDRSTKKIIWAAKFDTGWGRWRDSRLDPVISYDFRDGKLIIDEDGHSKAFSSVDFKR